MTLSSVKDGDDIGLRLDLVSDEDCTRVDQMLDKINRVANTYGFKIRAFGSWANFRKMASDEQLYIKNLE
jgi:hypothetical protein